MNDGPVLVTGITGLIGGAVARRLHDAGRRVIGMDTAPTGPLPFPVVRHDLPDAQRWHEVILSHGIRQVVHAGGISGPMVLRDQPSRIAAINLQGLIDLLEASRLHGLGRIVWFSSINAYGPRPDLSPVSEDTALSPDSAYAGSKAAGEAMLSAYRQAYGVDAVGFRLASCYGPGRTTDCLMRTIAEDGLAGRPTRVHPNPGRTRQHIFVDDVIDTIEATLNAGPLPQAVYNLGPGYSQSLAELETAAREVFPHARLVEADDGFSWNTFPLGPLDITAARRDLDFNPTTSLAEGLARTAEWVGRRTSS